MKNSSLPTKLRQLLSKLNGIQDTSNSSWQALCPAHDDNTPSLTVTLEGKKILLYCHAGCETSAVVKSIGMTERDLFINSATSAAGPKGDLVKIYDYHDRSGQLVSQVLRYEPKSFRQRRYQSDGTWEYSTKGCRQVPYRLTELLKAKSGSAVYIVEGEKDVDRLMELGLIATTNAMGAGKWTAEHAAYLTGFKVVILPDNDAPGRKHAQRVAKSLVDIAASIKIVELPNLPEKGDVSDWIDAGGELEALKKVVQLTPPWIPTTEFSSLQDDSPPYEMTCLADVVAEKIEWLWRNRIPLGKVTMFAGDPGLGKSLLALDIAARVSAGTPWPEDAKHNRQPASVLLVSAEDDLADTIRPRLDQAKADQQRIHALEAINDNGERRLLDLSRDLERLEEAIDQIGDCRLVVSWFSVNWNFDRWALAG